MDFLSAAWWQAIFSAIAFLLGYSLYRAIIQYFVNKHNHTSKNTIANSQEKFPAKDTT